MVGVPGFSRRLFESLANEGVNVILITQGSSEHSICVGVDSASSEKARNTVDRAFEVEIANPDGTTTVVLADHMRNVDWKARNIQWIRRVTDAELSDVVARIDALLVSPDA